MGNLTIEMATDASTLGWGAVCNGQSAQGMWSPLEKQKHICTCSICKCTKVESVNVYLGKCLSVNTGLVYFVYNKEKENDYEKSRHLTVTSLSATTAITHRQDLSDMVSCALGKHPLEQSYPRRVEKIFKKV